MAGPDHCMARRECATEIVALAGKLRDPVLELLGRRLHLVAMLETGAVTEADDEALAYRTVARALRHPLYQWCVPLWRGMCALLDGRFDDCRAALDEATALGARAASENAAILVATQRWCLLAELGDRTALETVLTQLEAMDLAGGWPQVTRSLLLAQLGRTDESRAQLDAPAPPAAHASPRLRVARHAGTSRRDGRHHRSAPGRELGVPGVVALRPAFRRGRNRCGAARAGAPPSRRSRRRGG